MWRYGKGIADASQMHIRGNIEVLPFWFLVSAGSSSDAGKTAAGSGSGSEKGVEERAWRVVREAVSRLIVLRPHNSSQRVACLRVRERGRERKRVVNFRCRTLSYDPCPACSVFLPSLRGIWLGSVFLGGRLSKQ